MKIGKGHRLGYRRSQHKSNVLSHARRQNDGAENRFEVFSDVEKT